MATMSGKLGSIAPKFIDAGGCRRWIATVPLTNHSLAQRMLSEQIALIRQAGVPALELLRILDVLREPVAYVQAEVARKYAAKPLPLDSVQAALWSRTLGLWHEMSDAYLYCRDAYARGDSRLKSTGAWIVMNGLRYTASMVNEHYRIYRVVPDALWQQLYQLFLFAELREFATTPVEHPFDRSDTAGSCATAFCSALLTRFAEPYALSGRQAAFLYDWVESFANLVATSKHPPAEGNTVRCIDLTASGDPSIAPSLGSAVSGQRYLDLAALSNHLRRLIMSLKQGVSPAQLGLGEDARQPGCENLLMLLYLQWCRAGTMQARNTEAAGDVMQACLGLHSAHFHIGGRAFRAPGSPMSGRAERDLELFGHVSNRTEQVLASGASAAIESWRLCGDSQGNYLRLLRDPGATVRLSHNQLVALGRAGESNFRLGLVQWLQMGDGGEMMAGVRLFPGGARAVAAKPTNFSVPGLIRGFERGLLLPQDASTSSPPSLILPNGWYQSGRIVEVHGGSQVAIAKLKGVLEIGADFERCAIAVDGN